MGLLRAQGALKKRKVNTHQTIQPQRLRRLLRRLVEIYSPSGKEEEILTYLHAYLKRHGLAVKRQEVDENRYNLLMLPEDGDARVVFLGHVDTVMAYDLESLALREDGDLVMGLGAADMKGNCAAMVEAFLCLSERGLNHVPAALALVVGEEEYGDGAKQLVQDYHFPWAVIGEPTDLRPCLGHYGYLEVQLRTFGKRRHASLARRKENAIEAMLQAIVRVSHRLDRHHPEIVYNVRDLFSSQVGFAVPDRCEAWLDLHLPPSAPIGICRQEVEEAFARGFRENASIGGSLRIVTIATGYELPEKGSFVRALKSTCTELAIPWEPQSFRSHSDANQLWAAGVKPVLFGAGRLEKAHAPDEGISFKAVCLAAKAYLELLTRAGSGAD